MNLIFDCLTSEHDWRRAVLAVAISLLAAVVAISLFHRAQEAKGFDKAIWLSMDAAAAGYGIWATHFVAILAYDHTFGAGYDLSITILSLGIAIVTTGAGIYLAAYHRQGWGGAIGGAIVGIGIAAMHFTGIAALDLPGSVSWSTGLVAASVLFGIGLGAPALYVATREKSWSGTIFSAVLLAFAILATHFTAMGAMTFTPDPGQLPDRTAMSPDSLSVLVAGAAAMILGMCLVAALGDRQSKDRLRQQKSLLDAALENMPLGLCMFEADGRIKVFNARFSAILGLPSTWMKGRFLADVLERQRAAGHDIEKTEEIFARVHAAAKEGKSSTKIFEGADRAIRVIETPMQGGGWVATLEDITEWRDAQAQISHMAKHDPLTDLANRNFFSERLNLALRDRDRTSKVAILCVDLDRFKDVNDELGHAVGDELLKAVSSRLIQCVRITDTVARVGGDEFAIVQTGERLTSVEIGSLAHRIVEAVGKTYVIKGHRVVIGASVGISVAPEDGTDPDLLLKNADIALYCSKRDGRGAHRFFEKEMEVRIQTRHQLELDLRSALLRDEFELYYQPIHNIQTGDVVCFEALLRWNDPVRGMMVPADFISHAEESGQIIAIGEWALRAACREATKWSDDVHVAVNVSPTQFKDRQLLTAVIAALDSSGLQPERLELEITESVLMQDNEEASKTLQKLVSLGIGLSMDDFGTGFCSLSYLLNFPFNKIKIDRSFIRGLPLSNDSMVIVRAVVELGKSLGLTTVAEGVETVEQ
ncbi:MAG: EAL domain-containing protein, partial [Hyphomicrobium sp.]